jgi:hypothetical protein
MSSYIQKKDSIILDIFPEMYGSRPGNNIMTEQQTVTAINVVQVGMPTAQKPIFRQRFGGSCRQFGRQFFCAVNDHWFRAFIKSTRNISPCITAINICTCPVTCPAILVIPKFSNTRTGSTSRAESHPLSSVSVNGI